MADYDNTNRGVLFRNQRKETEKHPDYTGKIDVDGRELRLAAWIRTSKNGNKFMSLSVSEPQERTDSQEAAGGGFNDEIPFAPIWWAG